MDNATKKLMECADRKGVSVAAISKNTAITPGALYPCANGDRALRADEFFAICKFLGVDPLVFADTEKSA